MAKFMVAAVLAALVAMVACGGHYGGQGHGYGHGYGHKGYNYDGTAKVYVDQNPYGYKFSVDEHGPYHSKYHHQSASHGHGYDSGYGYGHHGNKHHY